MGHYLYQHYPYRPPAQLTRVAGGVHPVLIVGAGPVGLSAAIDLALHDVRSVVLDDNDVVSVGSRAICWAKRTLEIFDRLGVAERMVEKGVTWRIGRVYHRDQELYSFDLLPEPGHKLPAFINLQQYYVEQYLIERALEFPDLIELRWKHRACAVRQDKDAVTVEVDTPDGRYTLQTQWLIAADGARSTVRTELGLPFEGHVFEEKFLIADIRLPQAGFPSDRRFWFQPVFDPSESVLMHRQPDDIFRIDFQLGWDADAQAERQPGRVAERVRRVIAPYTDFELDWCSVYTFRCARMERFVHGRVLFAGDSAHVVSPFGARGGNGGIQDADNLCWKLAQVVHGQASPELIETYNEERILGCEENIRHSSRTTRFMTPKTSIERQLRDAVLTLAREHPFARSLINGGRLSRPCSLCGLSALAADDGAVTGAMVPGMPCVDAPVELHGQPRPRLRWLLEALGGGFVVLTFVGSAQDFARCQAALRGSSLDSRLVAILPSERAELPANGGQSPVGRAGRAGVYSSAASPSGTPADRSCVDRLLVDVQGLVHERYGGVPGVTYLIRPDQHVAARWARFDVNVLAAACERALGREDR